MIVKIFKTEIEAGVLFFGEGKEYFVCFCFKCSTPNLNEVVEW